jgi:amino acid transporter
VGESPLKTQNLKQLFRTQSINQVQRETVSTDSTQQSGLRKTLGVLDLTSFGVAAIIGAGIFSTIGNAVHDGGPAVMFLFIFTAIVCIFSALCYAEFASRLPVAGSAYTYAYVSFGEIFAWIIGWDLLMEYAISNIAVAISWSEYFSVLLAGYGIHVPNYLSIDFLSASRGFDQVNPLLLAGKTLTDLATSGMGSSVLQAYHAWIDAPRFLGLPIICNLPALGITMIVTAVAYVGIQESKITSNIFVILKLLVILLVIVLGAFYVNPENWIPFAPHGASGVFKGVSAVFFAYIGFDAISTTAEECKNPQRDLPRSMLYSLGICTLLYVLVSLVLTGMVPSHKLAVGDPLAYVFGPEGANIPWVSGLIAASAVVSLFTVLLVYQLGQPRIWMVMSRDGLLPPLFSAIHPKFKTPWFSTILTGVLVAVPSLFMNLTEVTNLASIGTLFAFALVCGGVLCLPPQDPGKKGFRLPYINSKYIFPILIACAGGVISYFNVDGAMGLVNSIPMAVFSSFMIVLSILSFTKNLSLIPVLGLSTCSYLITELGLANWIRFGLWLVVGLFIYFAYGVRNSKLKMKSKYPAPMPSSVLSNQLT